MLKYPSLLPQTGPQLFLYAAMFVTLGLGIKAQKVALKTRVFPI
jgi:hypothetical protein